MCFSHAMRFEILSCFTLSLVSFIVKISLQWAISAGTLCASRSRKCTLDMAHMTRMLIVVCCCITYYAFVPIENPLGEGCRYLRACAGKSKDC